MFDNSDDYDFNPSASSKLAVLFDNPMGSNDLSSSLTYTAPKQPKVERELEISEPMKNKVQTSLLLAKVVSLWKLENKDYKMLGKHGLAVIGSQDLKLYEIIVYKEKNNILLRRKISSTCSFFNQKECFSSFYDNDNRNWLVKFESLTDQSRFCNEIQSYGANIKTAEGPPQKKEETPSNSNNTLTKSNVSPKSKPSADLVAEEVHSDSSGSQKRANILSRMAKMGQQMLPHQILKNTGADVSDSEVEEVKIDRKVPPRKFKRTIHTEKSTTPKDEAVERQAFSENQMVLSQSNNLNYSAQFPPIAYNQTGGYDGFNHYIATQNTELKMNLAQISAKLDSALSGNIACDKYEERALKAKIKALELKSENLETELQRYEERYHELQKKYDDLKKKSNPKEREEHKILIQNLTEEMGKVKLDLKAVRAKVINYEMLEQELEACKNDIKEREKIIEIQKAKLKDFEEFNEENKDNTNLQTTIESLNETVATLKLKLKDFKEYIHKTEEEKQKRLEEDNEIMNTFSEKIIKENMDDMYRSILANFREDASYPVKEIKSVIIQNLKGTTFKIIEDFRNMYRNEDVDVTSGCQTE